MSKSAITKIQAQRLLDSAYGEHPLSEGMARINERALRQIIGSNIDISKIFAGIPHDIEPAMEYEGAVKFKIQPICDIAGRIYDPEGSNVKAKSNFAQSGLRL